ncbi:MAG: glycosyltransferase [Desulfurivibrionaceae bacterium]
MGYHVLNFKRLLYAPNIHQGGGRALLLPLLAELQDAEDVAFVLDDRLQLPDGVKLRGEVYRVKAALLSRLGIEWRLKRFVAPQTRLLGMGNLPPLFAHQGEQLIFVQNRYLIDPLSLDGFSRRIRLRIWLERWWLRSRARYVNEFIVQTATMRVLLQRAVGKDAVILPFAAVPEMEKVREKTPQEFNYDFVYVATGEAHKNHEKLIEAWIELAGRGIFPTLCLTLDAGRFPDLCAWINNAINKHSLKVFMIGECSHEKVMNLYENSRALIFPSLFESFGLPLIESVRAGLPVLASDLDYVKDVIQPSDSFDPLSPHAIADAVCCFSFQPASLNVNLLNAGEFLQQTLNRDEVTDHGISRPGLANLTADKRLQGAGDARHRPVMCTDVHEQGDNTADSVPCDRLRDEGS